MSRLTVRGATSQRDIDRLFELSNDNQFGRNEAYYKLQHYEDLEERGRLIELPCKVGDKVYSVHSAGLSHDEAWGIVQTAESFDEICQMLKKGGAE